LFYCAAELKKKSNKPKRPSIKSLFGKSSVCMLFINQDDYDPCLILSNQTVETKLTEDETSGGTTTHQGSFLNLLPTQIEDPEKEGSKSSSSG